MLYVLRIFKLFLEDHDRLLGHDISVALPTLLPSIYWSSPNLAYVTKNTQLITQVQWSSRAATRTSKVSLVPTC